MCVCVRDLLCVGHFDIIVLFSLPNPVTTETETRSYTKVARRSDGSLQALPMPKQEYVILKHRVDRDNVRVVCFMIKTVTVGFRSIEV